MYSSKLASASQSNYTNNHYEKVPLHPLIVESVSNPTLLTRKIIPEKMTTEIVDKEYDEKKINEFFKTNIENQQYALKFSQDLSMRQLELIVEYGLNGLNILGYSDLFHLFEKSSKKDLTKIEKFADELLLANYRYVIS